MRRWFAVLAVPFLVAGCSGKHEAKTGKEFFEKSQKAVKDKDVDTIWKMMSKREQKEMTDGMQKQIDEAKKDEKAKNSLKEGAGVDGDPTAMTPEALAKAMLKKAMMSDADLKRAENTKFVEERTEGNYVIVVTEHDGKKNEQALIKEDGYLKYDSDANSEWRKSKK